jgi:hypothetical protein
VGRGKGEVAGLAVATPISLPIYSGPLGRANSSAVATQIRLFCNRAGIAKPIVIVTVPTYASAAISLQSEARFYNRSDLHSAFTGVDVELIRQQEQMLFRSSDVVLYASEYLFEAEKGLAKRAVLIGHGVDMGQPSTGRLPTPRLRLGRTKGCCRLLARRSPPAARSLSGVVRLPW